MAVCLFYVWFGARSSAKYILTSLIASPMVTLAYSVFIGDSGAPAAHIKEGLCLSLIASLPAAFTVSATEIQSMEGDLEIDYCIDDEDEDEDD